MTKASLFQHLAKGPDAPSLPASRTLFQRLKATGGRSQQSGKQSAQLQVFPFSAPKGSSSFYMHTPISFTHHLNKLVADGFLIPPKREKSISDE